MDQETSQSISVPAFLFSDFHMTFVHMSTHLTFQKQRTVFFKSARVATHIIIRLNSHYFHFHSIGESAVNPSPLLLILRSPERLPANSALEGRCFVPTRSNNVSRHRGVVRHSLKYSSSIPICLYRHWFLGFPTIQTSP